MAETRPVWCPACGRKLIIPMATPTGRKARCGVCRTVFAVPGVPAIGVPTTSAAPEPTPPARVDTPPQPEPPPRGRRPKRPTAVGSFNIDDLPKELRAAMGPDAGKRRPSEPLIQVPDDEISPVSDDEIRVARRRAFDLDRRNNPMRRTGAGAFNIKDLPLPLDDD